MNEESLSFYYVVFGPYSWYREENGCSVLGHGDGDGNAFLGAFAYPNTAASYIIRPYWKLT